MAQPDRSGLSNPYAPLPAVGPARPRTRLARAAVLAGFGGAAALGLAGPAAAAPAVAAPVSPYDDGVSCHRLHDPVTLGATPRPRDPVTLGATPRLRDPVLLGATSRRLRDPVVPGSPAGAGVPWRCGVPLWSRPPTYPDPVDAAPEPDAGAPVAPPGNPIAGSQLLSVDGTVEAGVEPGCTVLHARDGGVWTLAGPLSTLPFGVSLTVEGVTMPDTMSTCQQGELLRVRQVALRDGEPGPTVPVATTHRLAVEARPFPVSRVYPVVDPACGPIGKIPTTALCTR